MEEVTVSPKGQIAIPKAVRDLMNLTEGAKLMIEVRGQEIVLSREPAWKKLHGPLLAAIWLPRSPHTRRRSASVKTRVLDSWAILECGWAPR
jgi:AbrB family looped-hinge helix DNA binding protein